MNILIHKIEGYKPNTIINIKDNDTKSLIYWRRRLLDAKIDGCCEVFNKTSKNKNMIQSKINKEIKEIKTEKE